MNDLKVIMKCLLNVGSAMMLESFVMRWVDKRTSSLMSCQSLDERLLRTGTDTTIRVNKDLALVVVRPEVPRLLICVDLVDIVLRSFSQ